MGDGGVQLNEAPLDDRLLSSGDESGTSPGDRRFRPDVEGLRAVAVLLVVLYQFDLLNSVEVEELRGVRHQQLLERVWARRDLGEQLGQQTIVGSVAPPTIGKPSTDFGGFLGEPVYRPLVAITEPNYSDLEDWKPTQLSTATTAAVRKAFRSRFPKVTNCSQQDIEHTKPWPYTDSNMVVNKAYSSNRHWLIAEIKLSRSRCDGWADAAFSSQWFVITPERRVRFLGSNMWLVDAGDYDNDGNSELVFSIDDYNRGGYKLFYDDFSRSATFEFGYH